LNQLIQGALKLVKEYKEKIMKLQNKFERCLKTQGHKWIDLIFVGINTLVIKHFTIGLLSKMWQQMKYEQVETFNEVAEVAKKNWEHGRSSTTNYAIHGQNS
jgi:hypothetical protein